MKVFVFLSLACLVSLLEGANIDLTNPIITLANKPLHDLINQGKELVEDWTSNSTILKAIDFNHTLNHLVALGEGELKNYLFNSLLPDLLISLRNPATDLLKLVGILRDNLNSLDVKNLALQLPNYAKMINTYLDLTVKILSQLQNGNIDAGTTAGLASAPLPTVAPATIAPTTPPPVTEPAVIGVKSAGPVKTSSSWWPFK